MSGISLELEAAGVGNSLQIGLSYPALPNLTYNFKLTLQVHQQDIATKMDRKVYEKVFHTVQKQIVVEGLEHSKMYKVSALLCVGSGQPGIVKNVFAFTRA